MRGLLVLGAAVLVAAGCASGSAKHGAITATAAPKLVLQPAELGPAFTQFDGGKQVMADRPPGPRFDTTRFGRVGGWKSRFKRAGDAATRGPLVVESRVDLFASDDGAKKDYGAYLLQYHDASGKALGGLGDEAHSITFTTGSGQFEVRYYTVAWRERNATASVSINGFKLKLADALRLARAQELRMAKAP
jgi:hypothetical protein